MDCSHFYKQRHLELVEYVNIPKTMNKLMWLSLAFLFHFHKQTTYLNC